MKDELLKLLKEQKIAEEQAEVIATVVSTKVASVLEAKKKEDDEAVHIVEERLKQITDAHKQEIATINANWKVVHENLKKDVLKSIDEDYTPYKAKLTDKVKNFIKENIKSLQAVVREQITEDVKKDSSFDKLEQIKKAIGPIVSEAKQEVVKPSEDSKILVETKKMLEEVTKERDKNTNAHKALLGKMSAVIEENKRLKNDLNKPLKEQASEVKMVEETKKEETATSSVISEMRYLAGYKK